MDACAFIVWGEYYFNLWAGGMRWHWAHLIISRGMATKKRRTGHRLSETDMKEIMRRGDIERDDTQAAERIDGLGASSSRYHDGRSKAERVEKLKNMLAQGLQQVHEEAEQGGEKPAKGGDGFAMPKPKLSGTQMLAMARSALKKAEGGSSDSDDDEDTRKAKKKAKKVCRTRAVLEFALTQGEGG